MVFILQQIKDIYIFGIVAVLLVWDIVFMLPPTIISSSILRREERELEGKNVSGHQPLSCAICSTCIAAGALSL